jgi:hypothetical protein
MHTSHMSGFSTVNASRAIFRAIFCTVHASGEISRSTRASGNGIRSATPVQTVTVQIHHEVLPML